MFIRIPGTQEYVNPKYVTRVTPFSMQRNTPAYVELWVVSNAGYGTGSIHTNVSLSEVIDALNNIQEK